MAKLARRVYGVLGVSAINAMMNADFNGYPKSLSNGTIYASDKSFKFTIKKIWQLEGRDVLYIKTMRIEKKKDEAIIVPRALKEGFENVFEVEDLNKVKDVRDILKNLFSAIDVKNFGATFAESGTPISITGAVQIGQGMNKYRDTSIEEQQILSPFRDPNAKPAKPKQKKNNEDGNEEDNDEIAKNSTLGTKIMTDEAHYFFPFSINPNVYKEFEEMGVTEGYTEEDYIEFKRAALSAMTAFDTNSKSGCDNEFGLFIETDNKTYLPNLDKFIEFEKGEKNTIRVNIKDLISGIEDKINSIEIYYNPLTTNIETDLEGVKMFNIVTQKEV